MQQHANTVFLAPVLVHVNWEKEARWTSSCFGPGQKDPQGIPVSSTTAAKPAQLAGVTIVIVIITKRIIMRAPPAQHSIPGAGCWRGVLVITRRMTDIVIANPKRQ